jgi:hypothetical protein
MLEIDLQEDVAVAVFLDRPGRRGRGEGGHEYEGDTRGPDHGCLLWGGGGLPGHRTTAPQAHLVV